MNEKDVNNTFIKNIYSALDDSQDNIDAATQSKITQARHRALARQDRSYSLPIWLPAGVVATACIVLLTISLVPNTPLENTLPPDDLELISDIDDLELLENLEFYEWLDEYDLPT